MLQDIAYLECEVDDIRRVPRVPYKQLSRLLTKGNFARLSATVQPGSVRQPPLSWLHALIVAQS